MPYGITELLTFSEADLGETVALGIRQDSSDVLVGHTIVRVDLHFRLLGRIAQTTVSLSMSARKAIFSNT